MAHSLHDRDGAPVSLRRAAVVLVSVIAVLVGVAAAGAWSLLNTQGGARWVLARVQDATGEALTYGSVEGSIAGGLVVERPAYANAAVRVSADRLGLIAHVDLFPLTVTVAAAEAAGLVVDLVADDTAADAPADLQRVVESLALPVAVAVESLALRDAALHREGEPLLAVDRLELALDWHDRIDLRSLTVGREDLELSATAGLLLAPPFELTAAIDAVAEPALTRLPDAVEASLRLDGSLERLGIELEEGRTGAVVEGELLRLLDEPAWDLRAMLAAFDLPGAGGIAVRDVEVVTAGSPGRFAVDLAGDALGLPGEPDARLHVELTGTGSTRALDVETLTLRHPDLDAEVRGRFELPARLSGTVDLQRLGLEALLPALGAPHTVAGSAGFDLSAERVVVSGGEFRLVDAPTTLSMSGEIDLASRTVTSELEWRQLNWPLLAADARLESPVGKAALSGTLDDWQADVTTVLAAADVAEGRFRVRGEGTARTAVIDIVEGDVFGGLLDGTATLDWSDTLAWQAEANIRGLRTAILAPAYPGILTTRLAAASVDSPSGMRLEILDLRGTILDEPISGGGRLAVSADTFSATGLRLAHGSTELAADGSLYAEAGMDFSLTVPDLARYGAAFAGDIELAGNVAWSGVPPRLELDGKSRFLRVGDVHVEDVAIETRETAAGGVVVESRAADVGLGQRRLEAVRMQAMLERESQSLSLDFEALGSHAAFAMTGAFADAPGGWPWTGEIRALSLAIRSGEGGGLDAPVPVQISPDAVVIEDLCLSGNQRGRLCASLDAGSGRGLTTAAEATEVPIDVLNAFLQTGFEFEQLVSGSVAWHQPPGAEADGRAALRFSRGKLTSARFPGLDLETGDGFLDFEVAAGQLLSGRLALPLGPKGFLEGEFSVGDVVRGSESPIEGSLRARTGDVDVLAVMLPDTEDASGNLEVDVAIGGTVREPAVVGIAVLQNAAATYFPLGLRLSDVNLRADFDENRHIDLEGSFRAGEGRGEILTTTRNSNGQAPGVHVRIRGSQLAVIDLPDVSAVADTDLRVDYRGRRLDINGSLDVPRARVRPVDLAAERVDESEDVVIVSGSLPDAEDTGEKPAAVEVYGELALGMGDDVMVVLDRARASIAGRAEFEWSGDPVPIGRGRYAINGTVQAFGQVLDISEGAVRFPAVPVTDPLLDIRATREIFGNSQVRRAGVLVQGPLSRPTIEAYTYPMTTEERALTLLVTGNDFDAEQGVGAIDFGTYIAPRLFLSYGVGVFDRENIISARYDLKGGFGIRATSGENASGIDLTYRLER